MKYFMDTEFHEYKKKHLFGKATDTIELISIGIVAEDGREYYAICNEFNMKAAKKNKWLKNNVIDKLPSSYFNGSNAATAKLWKSKKRIAQDILKFTSHTNSPLEFWAYYGDYDWVVFCWLFGRMIDLPTGFPMYCRDLKQVMDENDVKKQSLPINSNAHNALDDARWNKQVYTNLARRIPLPKQ